MITLKLRLEQWLMYVLSPLACAIWVAWMNDNWTLVVSLGGFYFLGIATHRHFLASAGFGLIRATARCGVPNCTYTCSAGAPPDAVAMMEAHLAEVHEIYPGFTDTV